MTRVSRQQARKSWVRATGCPQQAGTTGLSTGRQSSDLMRSEERQAGWMPAPRELPTCLEGRLFTRAEASAAGVTTSMLRGRRVRSVGRDLFQYAGIETRLDDLVRAALRRFPHATVSHTTNLALRGLEVGPTHPIHLATNRQRQVRQAGVILHRYQGELEREMIDGLPLVRPERTFVDCGVVLDLPELMAVGDWLVGQSLTSADALRQFCEETHYDGVQRARVAAELVRAGSESFRESVSRFHIVSHGLPEPSINVNLLSDAGTFLGRGDMPFPKWKVLAEYDGWHHERSAQQRQYDILRREGFDAAGWLIVVLTSADSAQRVAWRVFNALRSRGYSGPVPRLDPRFARWMRTRERAR